jgi:hypothetical protein
MYQGSEDIGKATQLARDLAARMPAPSGFKRWLCRNAISTVYPRDPLYPGEGRHTYSRAGHSWGPFVHWRNGCNFYDIAACRCCDVMYHKFRGFNPRYLPDEWFMAKGCPTNPLALP